MSAAPWQLYGLKRCDTCLKAQRWLDAQGVPYTFTDYREQPVAPAVLADWAHRLGGWEKLVNRASTTWRSLGDARKQPADDAQWLALIAEFPALVRRPVCLTPQGGISVGFKPDQWQARLANT